MSSLFSSNPATILDTIEERLRDLDADVSALKNQASPGGPFRVGDDLRELVDYGDLIIRKVQNGYIIRRVPEHMGRKTDLWVVEGGQEEMLKQLAAINAADVMNKIQESADPYVAASAFAAALNINHPGVNVSKAMQATSGTYNVKLHRQIP